MNDIFNENVPLKTETPAFAKHVLPAVPSSEVYLEDCVKALKRFNDNHFDLAIVDPPYGIELKMYRPYIKKDRSKEYNERQKNNQKYSQKDWDNKPSNEYWEELFRVSKNQIVCGAYMFTDVLRVSKSWILWDKKISNDATFSPYDMFWTSFTCGIKKYEISPLAETNGGKDRIHPTQKPIKLYEWILKNYAKPNDLILDTHLGSGSSRIASYKGGFNFVGFEIDQEYYEKQEKRFNDFKSQLRLF